MQFVIVIVLLIAAAAVTALTSKRPPTPSPALFSAFTTPQSAEGTPQIVIFGDVWLDDWMVLWYGNYHSYPIYASGSGKGK